MCAVPARVSYIYIPFPAEKFANYIVVSPDKKKSPKQQVIPRCAAVVYCTGDSFFFFFFGISAQTCCTITACGISFLLSEVYCGFDFFWGDGSLIVMYAFSVISISGFFFKNCGKMFYVLVRTITRYPFDTVYVQIKSKSIISITRKMMEGVKS